MPFPRINLVRLLAGLAVIKVVRDAFTSNDEHDAEALEGERNQQVAAVDWDMDHEHDLDMDHDFDTDSDD